MPENTYINYTCRCGNRIALEPKQPKKPTKCSNCKAPLPNQEQRNQLFQNQFHPKTVPEE